MSSFEYVMVIVSIIMGLGVTTLLRGTVHMLRAESAWRPSLLHSLWVVNLLLAHVGLWSLRWSGVRREEWPFFVLLAYLLMPIILYGMAELIFPRSEREVDLSEYFLSNRRVFFGAMTAVMVMGWIGPFIFYDGVDPLQRDQGPALLGISLTVVITGTFAAFAFVSSRRLHLLWGVAAFLPLLGSFGVLAVG